MRRSPRAASTVPAIYAGGWLAFCATPKSGTLTAGAACSSYLQVLACGGMSSGQTLSSGQSVYSCSGGAYRLVMQGDGNLVEYDSAGRALWASNTSGKSGATVSMQGDGNLVVYYGGSAVWSSNTSGHAGATLTVQGSDGNVVIYQNGSALWATGT